MAVFLSALLWAVSVTSSSACTALVVDGAATTTGAAFAVENVDCDNCDYRLTYIPPKDYSSDATRPVYLQKAAYPRFVSYDRSDIYLPVDGQEAFKPAMHIPQVSHTYGYYESACPLMNDKGLGIAESSCAAMLLNKAPTDADNRSTPVAILDAAALMQIVLERCTTAKCGAELIGEMCESYGYLPFFGEPTEGINFGTQKEWDDAGEAYVLADKSGEAWVVHVLGGVNGIIKSVWAAQKVPKGHVVAVPNQFIIGELPAEPNDDFLFSPKIYAAAKATNWDGKGKLHFSKVFAPNPVQESAPKASIPDPLYGSLRQWRLLNLVAPSLNIKFEMNPLDYPFSVKAEKKLTHRDIMDFMKDHYAGTEFDMTKGMLAGPFGTPFRYEGGGLKTESQVPRGISIMRSIYAMIAQTGPQGSVVWFAPDTAATSVYMPLDYRTGALSSSMYTGTYMNFTRESAFWAFDFVANWMQLNYQGMFTEDVKPRQDAWQDRIDAELAEMTSRKAGVDEISHWQVNLQDRVVADWWKLADKLVPKWNDGERSDEKKIGASWGYPVEWAKMVGLNNDIHPRWVQPADAPIGDVEGYVPATASLPRVWDHETREWKDWSPTVDFAAQPQSPLTFQGVLPMAVSGLAVFAAGSFAGFAMGRRQMPKFSDAYNQLLA